MPIIRRFTAGMLLLSSFLLLAPVTSSQAATQSASPADVQLVAPNYAVFYGVSCTSPGNCVGVGFDQSTQIAMYAIEVNGVWPLEASDLITTGTSSIVTLNSVSCVASRCVAVGSNSALQPIYVTESNGVWSSPIEDQTASQGSAYFSSVSCVSASECVVAGRDWINSGTSMYGLINPSDTTGASNSALITFPDWGNPNWINSVSCSNAHHCLAVGGTQYSTAFSYSFTVADVTNLRDPLNAPTQTNNNTTFLSLTGSGNPIDLSAVSCTSLHCFAVGDDPITGNPLYVELSESDGSLVHANEPTTPSGTPGLLSGVDCSNQSTCTAVGSDGNAQDPLIVTFNEATLAQGADYENTPVSGAGTLSQVACPTLSTCVGVGQDLGSGESLILNIDATPTTTSTPGSFLAVTPVSSGGSGVLNAVSCVSVNNCVGAGVDGSFSKPFFVVEHDGSWGSAVYLNPPSGNGYFNSVSCFNSSSTNLCLLAGGDKQNGTPFYALINADSGTEIIQNIVTTSASGSNPPTAFSGSFTGVSCVSHPSALCVAVGIDQSTSASFYLTINASGSVGTPTEVVNPNGHSFQLASVFCADLVHCTAVGTDNAGSQNEQPFTSLFNPTTHVIGATSDFTMSGISGMFNSVSCTDATDCVAVGQMSGNFVFYAEETAGNWQLPSNPNLGISTASGGGFGQLPGSLASVSCTSVDCVAVGLDVLNTAEPAYVAIDPNDPSGNGNSFWTDSTSPNGAAQFLGVSCVANSPGTNCATVGQDMSANLPFYNQLTVYTVPLVDGLNRATARATISNAGLASGSESPIAAGATSQNQDTIVAGSQSIEAGAQVSDPTTPVDFGYYNVPLTDTLTITSAKPTAALSNDGLSYTPVATNLSGNAIVITVDSSSTSNCSIVGGVITWTSVGSCTVDYNSAATNSYSAATASETFSISDASPTFFVNSTTDTGASPTTCATSNNTTCGFDDAIGAANGLVANTTPRIVFCSTCGTSTNPVKVNAQANINLSQGEILTVEGNSGKTYISGASTSIGGSNAVSDSGIIVVTSGTVHLNNLYLENGYNASPGNGGALSNAGGAVFLANSTVTSSSAYSSWGGGGIYNDGTMSITNSVISNNDATDTYAGGGGILNDNSGILTITNSTISGNSADYSPGGGGLMNVCGGSVSIQNSVIAGNTAQSSGGGGGISNCGTMTIDASTISNNNANSSPGGGGIFADNGFSITDTTISNNSADNSFIGGGGILNTNNTMTIISSTIAYNTATNANGGGVVNLDSMEISSSTIAFNSAAGSATGGSDFYDTGGALVTSTIFAGAVSNGVECVLGQGSGDDHGYNIDSDGSCQLSQTGSISHSTSLDASLGQLVIHYTGATATLLPTTSSPAYRVIPRGSSGCPFVDQNGFSATTACNIGAVENQPVAQSVVLSASTVSAPWSAGSLRVSAALGSSNPVDSGAVTIVLDSGVNGNHSSSACSVTGYLVSASGPATCYVYVTVESDGFYASTTSSDVTLTFTAPVTQLITSKPSAPTGVIASVTQNGVSVSFTPGQTGNLPVVYQVDLWSGGVDQGNVCVVAVSDECSFTNIGVGLTLRFTVRAVNTAGSAISGLSNAVIYSQSSPTITTMPTQVSNSVSFTSYFATNSSTLTPAAQKFLVVVAQKIVEKQAQKVTLNGYTDSRGTIAMNLALSMSRANSVAAFLIKILTSLKAPLPTFDKIADGVSRISTNLALNRRVVITF